MKAGRELDALVAEKLFGCRVGTSPMTGKARCECDTREHYDPTSDYPSFPAYSTEIAAAWLVVEKLTDLSTDGHVDDFSLSCEPRIGWWCVLERGGKTFSHGIAVDTAPLAICLAALRAVGVEVAE